jgi:hypothetical protein
VVQLILQQEVVKQAVDLHQLVDKVNLVDQEVELVFQEQQVLEQEILHLLLPHKVMMVVHLNQRLLELLHLT